MSDLLIRNFDSPKYGYREIRIYPDSHITEVDESGLDDVVGIAEYLPPHGRLVDADALTRRDMKKLRFKVAISKRQFHLWQRARIERKLSVLRRKMLDLLAEEAK